MELILVRHAQSLNNAVSDRDRVADPPLTDLGNLQAQRVAEWLTTLKPTRLFTSPFLRTLQTTDAIHAATGLTPEVRIALHEQGGCYSGHAGVGRTGETGLTRQQIRSRFPAFQIEAELDDQGWWRRRPFETLEVAAARADQLWQRTCEEFAKTSERVVYVMHADIKVLLLEQFHHEPLRMPCNASASKILVTPEGGQLVDFSSASHLTGDQITY